MIPLFNLRGYTAYDPLDKIKSKGWILHSIVTFLFSIGFLYVVFEILNISDFQYSWLFWLECIVMGFIYAPVVFYMRKSSSLLLMMLLVISMVPIDLYVESNFRTVGLVPLWTYNSDGLLGSLQPLLRIFVVWIGDSLILGPVCLWLSRIIASTIWKKSEKTKNEMYDDMFPKEFSKEFVEKPKFDFSFWVLRLLGLFYFFYIFILLLGLLGTSPYPDALKNMLDMTYENPALTVNTFIKIIIMTVMAFLGAYNKELRFHTSLVLAFGHLISTIFSLLFYYIAEDGAKYTDFLMTSAIVDGVLIVLFIYIMFKYKDYGNKYKKVKEFPMFYSFPNRITRIFYYVIACVLGLIVVSILGARFVLDGSSGWGAVYGFPDSQLSNSLTKYATMCFIAFLIASREGLRQHFYKVFLFGYSTSVVTSAIWMLGGMFGDLLINTRTGVSVTEDWYFMLNVALDGLMVFVLMGIRKMYYNTEYSITSLSPSTAQNIVAFHQAIYEGKPELQSNVLINLDNHVGSLRGRKRGLLNYPFWIIENIANVIFGLKPSFSTMDFENRRYFLFKNILRTPDERRKSYFPALAEVFYKIGNASHALITLANFNQLKPKEEIGFIPVDARDRLQGDFASSPPPFVKPADLPDGPESPNNFKPDSPAPSKPLIAPRVVTAIKEDIIPDEVDYIVIGSGAGGAVAAYRLASNVSDPGRILLVERGPRYSPLQDVNEDELEMIRKLYKDGGIQQTKRFDMMVFQGECLGGTTVINNAICVPMPQFMKNKWQEDFGIDLSSIDTEYSKIGEEIDIIPLNPLGINVKVKDKFDKGINGYNNSISESDKLIEAKLFGNHSNMFGTGTDNLGNKQMRKRTMLETYIPWAESKGINVVCNTSAVRFTENNGTATNVLLRSNIGTFKNVRVKKAVIVACGTIASSHFLMRSNFLKNVGDRMSCNFAFPFAFKFSDNLDAFDGLQITIGALEKNNRAIFETFFNPPAAFAASVPFYFNNLNTIMKDYRNLINFGALVGSEPNGKIELKADWINGRAFTWNLGEIDKQNVKYAFETLLKIGYHAGAEYAVVPTEPGLKIKLSKESIDGFLKALNEYPIDMSDLRIATAHPQGGNIMAGDNSSYSEKRVLNSDFKVLGTKNVYVVDASVFPTGITVNPQWTIMAMSSIASGKVLNDNE